MELKIKIIHLMLNSYSVKEILEELDLTKEDYTNLIKSNDFKNLINDEKILHYIKTMNAKETAKYFEIKYHDFRKYLIENNIPFLKKSKLLPSKQVIQDFKNGCFIKDIAKKYNIQSKTIREILNDFNLIEKNEVITKQIIKLMEKGKSDNEIINTLGITQKYLYAIQRNLPNYEYKISKNYEGIGYKMNALIESGLTIEEAANKLGLKRRIAYTNYKSYESYRRKYPTSRREKEFKRDEEVCTLYKSGMSKEEISRKMKLSVNTIEKILFSNSLISKKFLNKKEILELFEKTNSTEKTAKILNKGVDYIAQTLINSGHIHKMESNIKLEDTEILLKKFIVNKTPILELEKEYGYFYKSIFNFFQKEGVDVGSSPLIYRYREEYENSNYDTIQKLVNDYNSNEYNIFDLKRKYFYSKKSIEMLVDIFEKFNTREERELAIYESYKNRTTKLKFKSL